MIPCAEIWGHDDEDVRIETREAPPTELCVRLWWLRLKSGIHKPFEDRLISSASKARPIRRSHVAFLCLYMTLSELD